MKVYKKLIASKTVWGKYPFSYMEVLNKIIVRVGV